MLSASDLIAIRTDVAQLLPDTCTILTPTMTVDGYGGVMTTWGTATASVACRLDYRQGGEQLRGGAVGMYTGWMLTLPYDTTIGATNRVVCNGGTFAVTDVDGGKSWMASIRVKLERI